MYADDTIILQSRLKNYKNALDIMQSCLNTWELQVNTSETKVDFF